MRRATRDVETFATLQEVISEAQARGFHVIETGDQMVILCHPGEIIIHC